jgi:beta-aspartyl-peptidase (threonine type)
MLPLLLLALPLPDDPATATRALLDAQVAAWNRADLDAFLATYWDSPDLVFQSGGTRTKGLAATRERYKKRYQSDGRAMGRLAFTDLEIETLADDVALARGRWQLTLPDGSTPSGLFTLIVKKLPEGWRITHDHTSSDNER